MDWGKKLEGSKKLSRHFQTSPVDAAATQQADWSDKPKNLDLCLTYQLP